MHDLAHMTLAQLMLYVGDGNGELADDGNYHFRDVDSMRAWRERKGKRNG